MNLNKWGLPTQSDGDNEDCLNRCGLICVSGIICKRWGEFAGHCLLFISETAPNFVRYPGGNPKTTSGDQIIPIWCLRALGHRVSINALFFAPNTMDTSVGKWKLPIGDFILFRVVSLWARAGNFSKYFCSLFDISLILLAISDLLYYRISDDGADCNNTLCTLVTCNRILPTYISKWVWKYWIKRADVKTRIVRYHRAESGGNPEIAQMLCEMIDRINNERTQNI